MPVVTSWLWVSFGLGDAWEYQHVPEWLLLAILEAVFQCPAGS